MPANLSGLADAETRMTTTPGHLMPRSEQGCVSAATENDVSWFAFSGCITIDLPKQTTGIYALM